MLWGAQEVPDPRPFLPGPPGFNTPARRPEDGLADTTVRPPSPGEVRARRRAQRLDEAIYGPPVVHRLPAGGLYSHLPGGLCDYCDQLLGAAP